MLYFFHFSTAYTVISYMNITYKLICCVVVHEQMFMQGLCVEINKTNGLTALILYSALGN